MNGLPSVATDLYERSFSELQDALLNRACERVGYSNYGADDYLPGLRTLLASLDRNQRFTQIGKFATFEYLVNCLVGRLYSQKGFDQEPQSIDYDITQGPLMIIGLPRTGSTALHRLLAVDPQFQTLPYWVGTFPMKRPPPQEWASHPLFQLLAQQLQRQNEACPALSLGHHMTADGIDEDRLLLMQSFRDLSYPVGHSAPEYTDWLFAEDMQSTYERFQLNLKLIGSNERQKTWLLKNPTHIAVEKLPALFPKVMMIQMHRDPVDVIASSSSLAFSSRLFLTHPEIDPHRTGAEMLDVMARMIDRLCAARRVWDGRFYDVRFRDFVRDPIGVVRGIYRRFDLDFSGETEQTMRKTLQSGEATSKHVYALADYGLSRDDVENRFRDYLNRYMS